MILTKLKVLEKYPKISHTHFKPHRLRNIFGLEWPKSHKNAKIENGHFALNIDLSKTRGNKQKIGEFGRNSTVRVRTHKTSRLQGCDGSLRDITRRKKEHTQLLTLYLPFVCIHTNELFRPFKYVIDLHVLFKKYV